MTQIYRKAKRLVNEGKVHLEHRGFDVAYYTVESSEEYVVRLHKDRTLSCTCRAFTMEGHKGKLCSHSAAVIAYHTLRTPLEKGKP